MPLASTAESDPGPARLYALVPCAGIGTRSGVDGPKQYARLAGASLVAHTCAALAEVTRLTATLVVLSADDEAFEANVPAYRGWLVRDGGATRAETVARGLAHMAERGARAHDWVLVHDAARCLVRAAWIDRLIDACWGDAVGGLLALPVADTLKSERDGRVASTIDRHATWTAQTPQMFRLGALRHALDHAGGAVTDESSAMEAAGHAPKLVRGCAENLKVTFPADFDLAERLLASRR